ncbi:MAG: hypothetical protein AAGJ50_06800 [Pseudomonadota bacterium]
MAIRYACIAGLLPVFGLASCISAAENILDSIAEGAASAGSNALFNATEEQCRADPALLAERAVGLQFYKEKSYGIASAQCASKFEIEIDEAAFSRNYDTALRKACFDEADGLLETEFCSEATKALPSEDAVVPVVEAQADTPRSHSGYEVVSLPCDHEMFKRKRNVAGDARIDVETTACSDSGACYDKANLVDGNRRLSASPSNSWANAKDHSRVVDFVWETPARNIEQIYILTPHAVAMMDYSIEIVTSDGQQYQIARGLGNTEQEICHRFNPIDIRLMSISGGGPAINPGQIFLNEVVVR